MNRQDTNCSYKCSRTGFTVFRPLAALMLVAAFAFMWHSRAYAQDEAGAHATLRLNAPAQVDVGDVVLLTLHLEGAEEVGGFEAEVLYAREAGEFAGFAPRLPPVDAGIGQLVIPQLASGSAVGFYSCRTQPCLAVREAQVSAAAAAGVLAQVELLALTPGQLEISLAHVQVVDRKGVRLPVVLEDATVVVQVGEASESLAAPASEWQWTVPAAAPPAVDAATADVTQDGAMQHADVMEVALGWQIVREEGLPCGGSEVAADINGDGCVDIVDVQLAAAFADSEVFIVLPEQAEHLFLPFMRGSDDAEAQAASPVTFIVDSTLDEYDIKAGNGVCKTTSKVCTLRAAIVEANYQSGPVTILFSIPGGGVHTIQLLNRLPSLWGGNTVIDGYSQLGAAPNSDPLVSNAQIRVQLRGNGPEGFDGMVITSAGNVVQGLAFHNLRRSLWIYGTGAQSNVIAGNFIGTDATGTVKAHSTSEQQAHGVHLEQGAQNNRVGGKTPAERNIISGNARHGLGMWHTTTRYNVVYNNLIGLAPDGTRGLSNRVHGADINYGASYNTIGGLQPGERNVLSGNNGKGAEISHGEETSDNTIIGNFIGTDVTGTAGPNYSRNGNYGVSVKDRVVRNQVLNNIIANNNGGVIIDNYGNCCTSFNTFRNNRIGIGINGEAIGNLQFGILVIAPQSMIGPGNMIAYNPVGIQLEGDDHDGNTITQNSIFANTGLGIDISPIGQVNANDAGDADSGANEQLNFPVISSASTSQVAGSACADCTVEIFVADGGENEYGEGRTFIGSGTVAADGSFAIALSGVNRGDFVTATATDVAGNTSEFALNVRVGDGGQTPTPPAHPWEQVFVVPGRIEAENYLAGGSGVGYLDTTSGNSGRQYRNDDVDIEATQDSSGDYDVGWIQADEWLAYEIDVPARGEYHFLVRVSSPNTQRRFHIEIDGNNVSGSVTVPWTGGWQNWRDVTVKIPLTEGMHTLRFVAETDRFNVNYFEFSSP